MFLKYVQDTSRSDEDPIGALNILKEISVYTEELREQLDELLDCRLVATFFNLFSIILMFRERRMGLLLSELGGYLCGHSKAPAGTKRISNLLRSKKWKAEARKLGV